jgi:hypothetical protein
LDGSTKALSREQRRGRDAPADGQSELSKLCGRDVGEALRQFPRAIGVAGATRPGP